MSSEASVGSEHQVEYPPSSSLLEELDDEGEALEKKQREWDRDIAQASCVLTVNSRKMESRHWRLEPVPFV